MKTKAIILAETREPLALALRLCSEDERRIWKEDLTILCIELAKRLHGSHVEWALKQSLRDTISLLGMGILKECQDQSPENWAACLKRIGIRGAAETITSRLREMTGPIEHIEKFTEGTSTPEAIDTLREILGTCRSSGTVAGLESLRQKHGSHLQEKAMVCLAGKLLETPHGKRAYQALIDVEGHEPMLEEFFIQAIPRLIGVKDIYIRKPASYFDTESDKVAEPEHWIIKIPKEDLEGTRAGFEALLEVLETAPLAKAELECPGGEHQSKKKRKSWYDLHIKAIRRGTQKAG